MVHVRDSKFELMRIFAIFLVIYDHISFYTPWDYQKMSLLKRILINIPVLGGRLGVNIFFLITSYFLVTKTNYRLHSIIKLWLTTLFYSWIILVIAYFLQVPEFNKNTLLKSLFPISFDGYWFVTAYFFLMLVYPILNKVIHTLSQKQYIYLLLVGMVCLFIWSSCFGNYTTGTVKGMNFLTTIYFYFVGGYLRLYRHRFKILSNKKNINILIFLLAILAMVISISVIDLQVRKLIMYDSQFALQFLKFIEGDSPFQLIAVVALFLIIINSRTFYNRFINLLASTTLAVYIMHTNLLVQNLIWVKLIHLQKYQTSPLILLFILVVALVVMTILMFIDLFKQLTINPLENKLTAKLETGLQKLIQNLAHKLD